MFGQVGHHQPQLPLRRKPFSGVGEQGAQHGVAGVVKRGFQFGRGLGGQPRRVADNQVGAALGKQVLLQQADIGIGAGAGEIGAGGGDGARVGVGGADVAQAALVQQQRQHAAAGADVPRRVRVCRQRRLGDQLQIFAAQGRKHAVGHVDALCQHAGFDTVQLPLPGADKA